MACILKVPIHATPGAKITQAAGAHGAALRVRLAAPPVDGKANAALINWAARCFGVTKKQVQLQHGAAGRQKSLHIVFDNEKNLAAAQALLAALMQPADLPTQETK